MPFRRAAQELRDVYANEIARVVAEGELPAPELVHYWERYAAAADSQDPSAVFLPRREGKSPQAG